MTCRFCAIASGATPATILYQDAAVVAFLDHAPVQLGHVLLIPRAHLATFTDLPPAVLGDFFAVAQRLTIAVEAALSAEGTFVAMNNKVSQSVPHLHLHIVPRRKGDGLKGFFWPRKKYAGADELEAVAAAIRSRLAAPAALS